MKLLTPIMHAAMLYLLSQKTKAGLAPRTIKAPKGHYQTWFFYAHQKHRRYLCRLDSVMAGCIGQPLKRLAGSLAGSANPIQSATQRLAPKGGGLSLYQGVIAVMRNYAQNQAKSSQTKQSRFNLIKRTPEGKRVICQDLTFAQAAALVAEIPAAIVKFSRLEAVQ